MIPVAAASPQVAGFQMENREIIQSGEKKYVIVCIVFFKASISKNVFYELFPKWIWGITDKK